MTGRGVDSAATRVAVTVAPVLELKRSIQFFLLLIELFLLNFLAAKYWNKRLSLEGTDTKGDIQ